MILSIRADVLQSISDDYLLSDSMIGLTISLVFWGFTLGIILCALIVDWVGMKCLHILSGLGYLLGIALILFASANSSGQPIDDVFAATGTTVLYLGFLFTGITQGIEEGVTNLLVATLFKRDKRRMLTKLHAWWPMGLIVGGLIAWALGPLGMSWQVKLAVVAFPTLGYLMLVIPLQCPSTELVRARVSSSVMFAQVKRPLFIVLMLMMWVAESTKLAQDQWFAKNMVDLLPQLGSNSILLLVYTAGLMFILRQYASGWIFALFTLCRTNLQRCAGGGRLAWTGFVGTKRSLGRLDWSCGAVLHSGIRGWQDVLLDHHAREYQRVAAQGQSSANHFDGRRVGHAVGDSGRSGNRYVDESVRHGQDLVSGRLIAGLAGHRLCQSVGLLTSTRPILS